MINAYGGVHYFIPAIMKYIAGDQTLTHQHRIGRKHEVCDEFLFALMLMSNGGGGGGSRNDADMDYYEAAVRMILLEPPHLLAVLSFCLQKTVQSWRGWKEEEDETYECMHSYQRTRNAI